MRETIYISTHQREVLVDVTREIQAVVEKSSIQDGLVSVYAQGATAAIMIQENWDESVQTDVVHLLQKLIPKGVWLHDAQDGNGDSHLKAGLVGPLRNHSAHRWQARAIAMAEYFFLRVRRPQKQTAYRLHRHCKSRGRSRKIISLHT